MSLSDKIEDCKLLKDEEVRLFALSVEDVREFIGKLQEYAKEKNMCGMLVCIKELAGEGLLK